MKTLEKLLKENRCGVRDGTLDSTGRFNAFNPLEKSGYREINYLNGLYDLVKDHVTKDTVMVEVGSHKGVSTELFAMHCKKIYAVDPWETIQTGDWRLRDHHIEARLEFEERMKDYGNIETILNISENACHSFDNESIDLVYIDGLHLYEGIKRDFHCWWPKVKIGGVISGHDNVSKIKGKVRAFLRDLGYWDVNRFAQEKWDRRLYPDTSWSLTKCQKNLP